jgi:hypothetical protein
MVIRYVQHADMVFYLARLTVTDRLAAETEAVCARAAAVRRQ